MKSDITQGIIEKIKQEILLKNCEFHFYFRIELKKINKKNHLPSRAPS